MEASDFEKHICEVCPHPIAVHYDVLYCELCACGPCVSCSKQFVEEPVHWGVCPECTKKGKVLPEEYL